MYASQYRYRYLRFVRDEKRKAKLIPVSRDGIIHFHRENDSSKLVGVRFEVDGKYTNVWTGSAEVPLRFWGVPLLRDIRRIDHAVRCRLRCKEA